ncbi:putative DNA mismatch repair protein Msh6 [Habropoda laboriosa]|uniref:DNA mismatch repair protein n=1 Tax=Habropoda laboriosa TaxID=597456 RepID=A0A0L7RGN9_9HYME|nr:PREDICTED: probable DNA mismatch repair protein Msh6 [Habropoda laboriosa]KOC69993.1 putative DNA mismatch repair protein Msh6 [Habropoda laboriosa]
MSKVNTLYNYFTSPKTPKQSKNKSVSEEKSSTPKRSREQRNKVKTPGKGKENKTVEDRKRIHKDDEEEEEKEEDEVIQPKKRRLIIPDVESGDESGDEFKPNPEDESEESDSGSEGFSESEPQSVSEEETPEKKRKVTNGTGKRQQGGKKRFVKEDKKESKQPQQVQVQGSNNVTETWRHLKYDFLEPNKIKDINRRPASDPNYDPKTLYVPLDFLNQQTPAMRQWWELKSRHYDCVLFFKVGKFYELYHMDAVISVNELNLTFMKGELAHSGFPEIGYGRFSASLIEKGYKVARVEQTENPEMMSQRCSKMAKVTKFDKVVKREICQISSKGTRVYTALDVEPSTPNSNYLLSLIEKCPPGSTTSHYGVCFLDTTIGDFYLGQFEDDRCNSRILTLLAHYPPVHVAYERGNLSQKTLQILNNALATSIKEPLLRESQFWSSSTTLKNLHEGGYFKKSESEFQWPEGLQPYLNQSDSLGLTPAEDKELAVHALGGCVYLLKEYLLEQQLLAQGRFKSYIPPDFSSESSTASKFANNMVLDAVTINNLRIFGEGSLMKTLDRCCTAFGKRLLREWICRPSCRKNVIIERQEAVQELMDCSEVVHAARSILASIPDLERLLSKIHAHGNAARLNNHPDGRAIMFEGKTYSKRKILDFTNTLNGFEEVLKVVALFEDFKSPLITRCTKVEPDGEFPSLRESLDYFKTAFDHEEAKQVGCIVPKKGVDDEYDSLLLELAQVKKDLERYLEKQRQHFGVKVTYHGSDKKRYQIEIPDSQVKKVGPGYELQSQRKGFKRYCTAETKELLSRQINAEEHRNKVLKDLNRRIFAQFSEKYDMWNMAVYKLSVIDVLISLSEYALSGDMCVPEVNDNANEKIFIDIRDGRHPCILSDTFIPNDTLLAVEDSAPFMILTGPNMGGKSTLMRQVALLTIMAQIGSYVPASSCNLILVDRIFTRLGANDDILAGQSTFLVELSETAAILQHATPYSLVLLDELGRGTSTYDGTAIAASVVDALTKLNCRTLFSTHYHSLVEDYKTNKHITLAHMACMVENEEQDEVSQETVTFLYKLSDGACPKSYGFNAARLAGVPSVITNRAHEISKKLEQETNHKHLFTALCKANGAAIRDLIAAM